MPAATEEAILHRAARVINMNLSVEEIELLDRYERRTLSQMEAAQIEDRLQADATFSQLAQQHFILIREMKRREERSRVREILNSAHAEQFQAAPSSTAATWPTRFDRRQPRVWV